MIKVNVVTGDCTREAIHPRLKGLSAESLRNLQSLSPDPLPLELVDIEYWPAQDDTPAFDARVYSRGAEAFGPDIPNKTANFVNALDIRDSSTVFAELIRAVDAKADTVRQNGFTSTTLGAPSGPVTIQRVSELAYIATDARKKKGGGNGNASRTVKRFSGEYMTITNNQINDFEEESADFLQSVTDREAEIYAALGPLDTEAMVSLFDTEIVMGWPA